MNKSKEAIQAELQDALNIQKETDDKLSEAEKQIKGLEEQLAKSLEAQKALEGEVEKLKEAAGTDPDEDTFFKSLDVAQSLQDAMGDGGVVEVNEFMNNLVNQTRAGFNLLSKSVNAINGDNIILMQSMLHIVKQVNEMQKSLDQFMAQPVVGPRGLPLVKKSLDGDGKEIQPPTKNQLFKALGSNIITQGEANLIKHGYLDKVPPATLKKVMEL